MLEETRRKDLSILIVTYNSRHLIDRLLTQLRDELVPLDGEVVVVDNASDDGYRAVAALRLSALMMEGKQYDLAQKTLEAVRAEAFVGLAQDRLGDLYALQNKQADAKAAYLKAFSSLDAASEYRRLIKIKLNALGVEPPAPAGAG
jgi:GT2 family glycosyltransferase